MKRKYNLSNHSVKKKKLYQGFIKTDAARFRMNKDSIKQFSPIRKHIIQVTSV